MTPCPSLPTSNADSPDVLAMQSAMATVQPILAWPGMWAIMGMQSAIPIRGSGGSGRPTSWSILSVLTAREKLHASSTTRSHTGVTQICSGPRPTGRDCAVDAMDSRLPMKHGMGGKPCPLWLPSLRAEACVAGHLLLCGWPHKPSEDAG